MYLRYVLSSWLVGWPLNSAVNKFVSGQVLVFGQVAASAKHLLGSSRLYPDSPVASPASREKFNFSKQANLCQNTVTVLINV